jgi:hypothetical protein
MSPSRELDGGLATETDEHVHEGGTELRVLAGKDRAVHGEGRRMRQQPLLRVRFVTLMDLAQPLKSMGRMSPALPKRHSSNISALSGRSGPM